MEERSKGTKVSVCPSRLVVAAALENRGQRAGRYQLQLTGGAEGSGGGAGRSWGSAGSSRRRRRRRKWEGTAVGRRAWL